MATTLEVELSNPLSKILWLTFCDAHIRMPGDPVADGANIEVSIKSGENTCAEQAYHSEDLLEGPSIPQCRIRHPRVNDHLKIALQGQYALLYAVIGERRL